MTSTETKQSNRNKQKKQIPTVAAILLGAARARRRSNGRRLGMAAELLRADHGAISRIAKRVGVHRSMVSKVANGKKTSERVRVAIIRYLLARQRELATAALLIEHGRR